MKFIAAAAALFATAAMSSPMDNNGCPGGITGSIALCCATDILSIADLDCKRPTAPIITPAIFQSHCASEGRQAVCCTLPVAGQGLLCQKAIGTQ
ncbi:hydrophobin [Trichoderma chlorosporum]